MQCLVKTLKTMEIMQKIKCTKFFIFETWLGSKFCCAIATYEL